MKTLITTIVLLGALCSSPLYAMQTEDIVIADFEGDSYGDWTVTGDCFGDRPATGTLPRQQMVDGFKGDGLVNSYLNQDQSTGTLTSPSFSIELDYINFLLGGGHHPGKTCINLLVNGEIVLSETGRNVENGGQERLEAVTWNVQEYKGQEAVIQIVDDHEGAWGHINVDHIVQSDQAAVSPRLQTQQTQFEVSDQYLLLPIGLDPAPRRGRRVSANELRLFIDGQEQFRYNLNLANRANEVQWYAYFHLGEHAGKQARVVITNATEAGFALVRQSDTLPGEENIYNEPHRPQFHFTHKVGWINDPNGMVYANGEWHFFFQHNPVSTRWGNMSWGHATSKDLIHWEQRPIALFPDETGTMYSGTGIVDTHNVTGLKQGDGDLMILNYSSAGNFGYPPRPFTQGMAYSNDGRTFIKFEGNPVVGNISGGRDRDPKVLWHEPSQKWVMVLYLDKGTRRFGFFTSDDLKQWEKQSEINGFFECPELFELPVDGDDDNTRWVLYGGDSKYVIGQFDGRSFEPDHEGKHQLHWGNYFAAQTFSNSPDGRRIQMGWMRGINTPGPPYNQHFSFPHRMTLRTTADGIRMFAKPIREIEQLRARSNSVGPQALRDAEPLEIPVRSDLLDLRLVLAVGDAERITLELPGRTVIYDAVKQQLGDAPLKPIDGQIEIQVLADRAITEIIGNDGRVYLTTAGEHGFDELTVTVTARGGTASISSMEIHELKSIWK